MEDMRMTLNDIGKALRKVLSAVARAAWGITLCAGGLAVGIAGEILLGVLNFMFGILTALLSIVTIIWTFIWLLTL
ncbi:putative membrane protein [Bacteroides fragilis str. 34-F-2 |nr:putative membrane protein [Bacteroides fragilis str. 2-F-2 \